MKKIKLLNNEHSAYGRKGDIVETCDIYADFLIKDNSAVLIKDLGKWKKNDKRHIQ